MNIRYSGSSVAEVNHALHSEAKGMEDRQIVFGLVPRNPQLLAKIQRRHLKVFPTASYSAATRTAQIAIA